MYIDILLFRYGTIYRGGFRLVGALGSTKCEGPLPKFSHSAPITSSENFRALLVLQIGEHTVRETYSQQSGRLIV